MVSMWCSVSLARMSIAAPQTAAIRNRFRRLGARISQRNVAVLAARRRHLLVHGHVQRTDERGTRLARLDDVVDVPPLRRVVRVGELLAVVLDELLRALLGIVRLSDVALEDDAHR